MLTRFYPRYATSFTTDLRFPRLHDAGSPPQLQVYGIPEVSISLNGICVEDLSDLVPVLPRKRDLASLKVLKSPLFPSVPQASCQD